MQSNGNVDKIDDIYMDGGNPREPESALLGLMDQTRALGIYDEVFKAMFELQHMKHKQEGHTCKRCEESKNKNCRLCKGKCWTARLCIQDKN